MKSFTRWLNFAAATPGHLLLVLEIMSGIFLSSFSFIIFLDIAADVVRKDGVQFDTHIAQQIYALRTPALTETMKFISFLGGEAIWAGFIIVLTIFIWKNMHKEAWLFSFTVVMGYVLNNFIKILLKIPRPHMAPILTVKFYSFPSGHTMNSCIFYLSLAYFLYHITRSKRLSFLMAVGAVALVVLIGFSRIYLGVHHPSDVVAGFVAGVWWLVTAILIDRTIIFYRLFQQHPVRKSR